MSGFKHRIPREVQDLLDHHEYRVEDGSKHIKYFVYGRLAFIWPKGSTRDRCPPGKLRCQVQRLIHELGH